MGYLASSLDKANLRDASPGKCYWWCWRWLAVQVPKCQLAHPWQPHSHSTATCSAGLDEFADSGSSPYWRCEAARSWLRLVRLRSIYGTDSPSLPMSFRPEGSKKNRWPNPNRARNLFLCPPAIPPGIPRRASSRLETQSWILGQQHRRFLARSASHIPGSEATSTLASEALLNLHAARGCAATSPINHCNCPLAVVLPPLVVVPDAIVLRQRCGPQEGALRSLKTSQGRT